MGAESTGGLFSTSLHVHAACAVGVESSGAGERNGDTDTDTGIRYDAENAAAVFRAPAAQDAAVQQAAGVVESKNRPIQPGEVSTSKTSKIQMAEQQRQLEFQQIAKLSRSKNLWRCTDLDLY